MTDMTNFEYFLDPYFPGFVWRYPVSEQAGLPVVGGAGEFKAAGNNAWYPSSTVVLDQILDGVQPTEFEELPPWVTA